MIYTMSFRFAYIIQDPNVLMLNAKNSRHFIKNGVGCCMHSYKNVLSNNAALRKHVFSNVFDKVVN